MRIILLAVLLSMLALGCDAKAGPCKPVCPAPPRGCKVCPPPTDPYPVIASNFDINQWIEGTVGTNLPGNGGTPPGAFRFLCEPSHVAYDDPIVYPNQPGASPHLHTFFGNTLANGNSTYQSLRTTGNGTCDGGPVNRTGYWMPSMFNGAGQVVVPDFFEVYYKAESGTPHFPRGLRFVFGFDMTNPTQFDDPNHPRPWKWYCDTASGEGKTIHDAGCPTGNHLIGRLAGPTCWNGALDSPNHRSHLAYLYYDGSGPSPVCPAGYSQRLPEVTVLVYFTSPGPVSLDSWYLSSDRMPGMPRFPGGTNFHSDWFGAWDDGILNTWHQFCLDGLLSCSGGQLGDGRNLKRVPGFDMGTANPQFVDPPLP